MILLFLLDGLMVFLQVMKLFGWLFLNLLEKEIFTLVGQ
jgi:hypothetical protein